MNRHDRWNRLLELLAEQGQLNIEDTAALLGVSDATMRRDFDELASQQLLIRTRGGATAHSVAYELPLRYKTARQAPEKQRIGAAAAALVPAGSTVGMNGGTTTTEVARALATRVDLNEEQPSPAITVVTNALNIASELVVRPHISVVVTGGAAPPKSYQLLGSVAQAMLASIALDVAIIGVDAVDIKHGISAKSDEEASISRLIAAHADQVIVVADGSKLGRRAFSRICLMQKVDILVTDNTSPTDAVTMLTDAGVKVLQA
ncbi:DeoR family transcriptional regulator of aga operon [Nonomuraea thailandensis]|uniref:DeoR family transcriptional regulator of aga operon n=1 Tax=Nonomuraea thailandensis TaxID=1188745 RepID=A0A9X2JYX9_9ACTN|nr:DeoR/GlpR family DNA-binding transcription regulator [Nonomuraea thailandensis]MCP2353604.1 DeoR family transcriptional regulator of aga operon [Nonomuraea thailandensis]